MNHKMCDLVGHSAVSATNPRGTWASQVVEVIEDVQIGRILSKLGELGIADETAIIITGDHGMIWYNTPHISILNLTLSLTSGACKFSSKNFRLVG